MQDKIRGILCTDEWCDNDLPQFRTEWSEVDWPANSRIYGAGRKFEFLSTAAVLCLPFSVWKWLKGVSCSDKMRPVGIGNGSLKIPSILWTFSICGMGDNLKDLWRVMAAIYNFTQVPLTLPLEAAVKNRHRRRVIRGRGRRRRRNGKRGFK